VLLVVGEPGMGKTRYAEAVLAGGERRGWHTLRGRARTAGGEIPYHAVVEALEPLLLTRPDLVARLSPGSRSALAAIAPAVVDAQPAGPVGRHRVLAAVGHLLREAALDRGVVLALEDLHAADEATIELLDFLTGGARAEPVLIVATTRPTDENVSVSRLRAALRQQPTAIEVELSPLPEDAIRELATAGRELSAAAEAAIVDAAAGNPLYAQELARAVEPSGRVRIPERLQGLLDERLSELPERVVAVLAVLEDGFSTEELASVAQTTSDSAEGLLHAADVLERDGDGWRFTHPLLRDAARRRAPAEALRRAHSDAAATLERDGAPPERIAYHLLQAGRGGEALPHLVAAAQHAAAIGAYADGRRWVEQALVHAGDHRTSALHALLGDLRFATGDRGALAAYADAARYASDDELPDVRSRHGRAALALGDLKAAEQAVVGLPAGSVAQRAEGCVTLAMLAWHRGDLEQASRLIDQAGALGEAAGIDVELLTDVRAMIAHASGRWETHAPVVLGEAWQLPALAGRVFDAYLCVTEYVLNAGDPYERLIRFAEDLRGQAERAGARRGEAFSCTVLGEAHLMRGELETARGELEHAVRVSREVGAMSGEALARARLGEALSALGDRTGARAQLAEALELSQASPLSHHLLFLVHAPLVRVEDDNEAAVAVVDRAELLLGDAGSCNFCPLAYFLAAAAACARAGDVARAESFLERAEHAADMWLTRAWSPGLCEARGEILRARDQGAEAAIAFRRALEGYSAAGQELNAARVRAAIAV
jgi:tetratricopeptide (TPR) repeat protein